MALVCDGQGLIEVSLIMDAVNQNETDIATLGGGSTGLDARVTQNEADIVSHNSRLVAIENTDITAVEARVTVNEGDIATNAADIITNSGNTTTNTNNAVALESRVTQNETDIATNVIALDANTSGLETVNTTLLDHEARIDVLEAVSNEAILLVHETADGIDGGTSTSATWVARTISTVRHNTLGVTPGATSVVLNAGTYAVDASCFANSARHQTRLSISGTTFIYGTAMSTAGESRVFSKFTISQATVVQLETNVSTGVADTGFGTATGFGTPNVYVTLFIDKVG